ISIPAKGSPEIDLEIRGQRLVVHASTAMGGKFETSVSVPQPIEADQVTALWANGVLTTTLPKQKGRRIALKTK
ncbi:MAG TPA: Hsp20 family protein, partial [Candidatus Binataceae bacterium]